MAGQLRPRRRRAAAPVPEPVDDQDLVEPGQRRVVEVAAERLERLVDPGAAQVERRRHRPRPVELRAAPTRTSHPAPRAAPRRAAAARPAPARRRPTRRRRPARGRRRRPSPASRRPRASPACRRVSSAAIRPSQPPVPAAGALAEPPRPRAPRPGPARRRRLRRRGGGSSVALRPGHGLVEARRGDRLALERLAASPRTSSRRPLDEPLRLRPGRADRLVALPPGPPPLLLGGAQRLGRPAPRRRAPGRAPRRSRPRSPGCDASVASNDRWVSDSRERASSTIVLGQAEPLGDRERLAAARQADRQPVGRRRASRGRTRPRRCAPPASCGRRP